MRTPSCLFPIAISVSLTLAGSAFAIDPPGSTPSSPPVPPSQGPASLTLPQGPTELGLVHVPPAPPGDLPDSTPDEDELVDELMGISVPLPPPSSQPGQGFATTAGDPGWQHLLEDGGCTWTNDNVAACLVLECDADGVCVEAGTYCVDHNGEQVPCP